MILGLFKISGHSMLPKLEPTDIVITSSFPYILNNPKVGDVIVFKKKEKVIIKRISKTTNDKVYVEGDNRDDSLDVGWVHKKDIIGKVLFKL